MLTGLSAFPLTPLNEDAIDEAAFVHLVERLVAAGVDSIHMSAGGVSAWRRFLRIILSCTLGVFSSHRLTSTG